MWIVRTEKTGVYQNLAAEEWMLNHAPVLPVLFLYVNAPCVVIGKNQNPWRECRLSLMQKEKVLPARRISGGGAVYHDPGNLNISVITDRIHYQEEKLYDLILATLAEFKISADRIRKNSLAIDGNKFSGHAFCFRGNRVMHHGTLLIHSDLDRLNRYLTPEISDIQTKAVSSVPSRVMNLQDAVPSLAMKSLSDALAHTFEKMYGEGGSAVYKTKEHFPEKEINPLAERNSSAEWIFCHTPRFKVSLQGEMLEVKNGRIMHPDGHSGELFCDRQKTAF